jgi:hypothetical protein
LSTGSAQERGVVGWGAGEEEEGRGQEGAAKEARQVSNLSFKHFTFSFSRRRPKKKPKEEEEGKSGGGYCRISKLL